MEYVNVFRENELLTGISILSVLSTVNKLEITKCLLIEPLLNYKSVITVLKRKNSNIRSIEELIIGQQIAFSNFNVRYHESLLLSINSIMLLSQLGLIKIEDNMIIFNGHNFDFEEKSLGKMALDRIAAGRKIADILGKDKSANLYLGLRIEL